MAVKYELTAVTGTYTDRDGNEKKRYAKCGVIIQTKAGFMAKLETLPAANWDGTLWLNEPKPKDQPAPKKTPVEEMSDDIPF